MPRRWKNFQNQILIGTQVIFYTVCQENLACASSSGHRPPPNSGTPPQKVLSSRPILMKQKPKSRSWSKLSFREKFFWKSLNFFQKIKNEIKKKCEFWPENFFAYESENYKKPKIFDFWYHFDDRPKNTIILCFIKILTLFHEKQSDIVKFHVVLKIHAKKHLEIRDFCFFYKIKSNLLIGKINYFWNIIDVSNSLFYALSREKIRIEKFSVVSKIKTKNGSKNWKFLFFLR